MIDKYEISLWEDFPDTTSGGVPFLNERKLCVIGSNTMQSQVRALEPKMVTNINGTNTFTFKMYYRYIDEITGEFYTNPFANLLINERKIKVFWKDQWYDMLIKNIDEDTSSKSVTYTCKDLFITELSRNGYNLEFSSDLQNNIGTAGDLAEQVLENSGWQFDAAHSTKIIQKTEEPVYEVITSASFSATKQSPNGDSSAIIPSGENILIFYSSIIGINTTQQQQTDIQFVYAEGDYITDENDMLVLNGDCYTVKLTAYKSGNNVYLKNGNTTVATINTINGVSTQFRAERLVKTQITKYDNLFDRYVNVYKDASNNNKEVWGYSKTEFSDPLAVVNLVANPSDFKSTDGWKGTNITWGIYPKFTSSSDISTYTAKSYLQITTGDTYNNGLSANQSFLVPSQGDIKQGDTGGFHIGDQYVFRVKVKANGADPSATSYKHDDTVKPVISRYNNNYQPTGSNYFSVGARTINGDWNEYLLTCTTAKAATEIEELGLFLHSTATVWIEDVQFFKYAVGVTSYGDTTEHRMNPGEVSLQGIGKTIYRYYNADHDGAASAEAVTFLYEGEEQPASFIPQTNNYEKMTSIEVKGSNRFNILQSIAENFECWVRFTINHNNETGKVLFDSQGLPQKYVTLVEYIGKDLGWCFEYGIDLRTIKRKIISDNLTTKIIVLPNENEYAPNGFCTIARSDLNYTRENFILNLDYFINQGLLNKDMLLYDLYSTSNNYIGYYYYLHMYNKEYDDNIELLTQKRTEYIKQNSQLTVLQNQRKATLEKIDSSKSDVMTLACATTWAGAQSYAREHADNTKVQSLMNTIAQLQNNASSLAMQIANLTSSINKLETYITNKTTRQTTLTNLVSDLHTRFFKKYARFLQEGTWQDSDYVDDDKYYLDAVDVAYTSSRPQLQYDINVMRLSALEDFTSKTFDVGDICYIQDREYFGYNNDGITPFKLKIIISEITSYFNSPEKDTIKVQNYKTQFDDLFQRITATTQSLQYASGGFEKAANAINPDRTLDFNLLQETFDENENWVLNASNQHVTWDSTGITVTDDRDAALQMKIIAGGLFVSNDGGATWKNAIRGDGISTDILTAGKINTSEIFVYDGNFPSFRWDGNGISAYEYGNAGTSFGRYVRFDRFGLYGYQGSVDFLPRSEDEIWNTSKFGITWKGFFLKSSSGNQSLTISDDGDSIVFSLRGSNDNNALIIESNDDGITFSLTGSAGDNALTIVSDSEGIEFKMYSQTGNNSLEISTGKDIVLKTGNINRVQIGRLNPSQSNTDYGIWVRDAQGYNIFNVSATGTDSIGGWNLTKDSFYHTSGNNTIGLYSSGHSATVQSHQDSYYILAGSKFGVTIDGNIYSSGGKIGGWTINNSTLTGGNITIDSAGNMSCTVNGALKWKLDNNGLGTFHNIFADIGYIAGWHIEPESIWNDSGTSLNSNLSGSYHIDRYTIVTDSIKASGGSVGGCTISGSSISGGGWSLGPSGGTIGGWSINANSISGGVTTLYSSGKIVVGQLTLSDSTDSITFGSSGGVAQGGGIAGSVLINTFQTSNFYIGQTEYGSYIEWLYSNWGKTTPNQVRAEGRNQVYAKLYKDGTYVKAGLYWNDNGMERYIKSSGSIYVDEGTGSVYLGYNYDPDGYVDAVRAVCSRCGHSSWWWL